MRYHYIISEQCNMNCSYCNVDVNSKINLSANFFTVLLKEIVEKDKPFIFDIFGGEVFLNIDIVQYIVSCLEQEDLCLNINITTNATIFNEHVKHIIMNKKVNCTISYDGLKQLEHRGKNKLFIKEFVLAGSNVAHCMLIGKDFDEPGFLIKNHLHMTEYKLNPDMTLVRDIGSWNRLQAKMFIEDYQQYVNFLKYDLQLLEFVDFPGLIKNQLNSILNYHFTDKVQATCGVDNNEYMSILSTGEKTSCERFHKSGEDLKKYDEIRKICDGCEIAHICNKGCIHEQIKNGKPIEELCYIYKEMYMINIQLIKFLGKPLLISFDNFIRS